MTVQYQGVWSLQSAAQLQSTQRWVTDPLFDYTTLLLQADDAANGAQNNTFLDSSSNAYAITRNGNTTQGSFTPFSSQPGAWGNFFGGSGNYLKTGTLSAISTTATTFTVECWVYMTQLPAGTIPVTIGDLAPDSNTANWTFGPISSGKVRFYWFTGSGPYAEGNTVLALNTWHHIAVSISSATISIYVNGVKESLTGTTTLTNRSSTLNYIGFGQRSAGGEIFYGYVSNARIVSGAALYSGDVIAVPSTPLGVASSGTTQLITCQSNRFLDNSSNAVSITPTGSSMTVQPFSPFAPQFQWTPSVIGGSAYFDNAVDSLTISTAINSQIGALAGKQRTYEFWVNTSGIQAITAFVSGLFGNFTSAAVNGRYAFSLVGTSATSSQTVRFSYTTGTASSANVTTTNGLNQQSWNHIAITIDATTSASSTIVIYLNGVGQTFTGVNLSTHTTDPNLNFVLGDDRTGNQLFWGYVGGVKISSGIQRSSNFTPPTSPFTSDANTFLLLNFTNAGIFDATMTNDLETVGNAQVSTSIVRYGSGSMYFDGTGDYLFIPASVTHRLLGEFTIEFWIYALTLPGSGAQNGVMGINTAGGNGMGILLENPGRVSFFVSGNGTVTQSPSNLISAATWTHVALVRSGTTNALYINGALAVTSAVVPSFSTTPAIHVGRVYGDNTTIVLNGYLDDFRITNGIARYTQNFIPPSVALPRQ